MKMKILVAALLLQSVVFSQSKFKVDFDYSRFFYNDSTGYMEIYYSYYEPLMKISAEGNNTVIKGTLRVQLLNKKTNNYVVDKGYRFNTPIDTTQKDRTNYLTGKIAYLIPFGEYKLTLIGGDANMPQSVDSTSTDLVIANIPQDRISISDVELATNIKQDGDKASSFYKNTFEVIPNPNSLYGQGVPVLYFYSELYNINRNIKSDHLRVDQILLNSNNKTVYRKSKLIPRTTRSAVDVGAINITKMPSGTYSLVVAASDTLDKMTVYATKKLFIYNPSIIDSQSTQLAAKDVMSSEFATMSEEEIDERYDQSKYIATSDETDQWDKLSDLQAKRKFLFDFWKKRNQANNYNTPDFKKDYFERVDEANMKFGNVQRKGWKTDRGRVLLMYGHPSEIERHPNQVDTKPYEIWYYNELEGGVVFVFADLTGFSDYQLIHSTKRGELRDDNWSSKIATY